ncbi:ABC transporter permease [uncultured Imperialibacter sp.]|mgnify:CR=1 FL=1|uniref:ABC transporter permease n=1 Tax=uncultured Imperialibacter sp. TaxID=1672639 RepID=UPI0030D7BA99|tara:strand:- start:1586 stop:4195 length:2610 start_codon:yes stop_codon:yes gene_type:complete
MNKTNTPPRLAGKLLLKLLRDDLAEEVLGDLEEKFYLTAERKSLSKARRNYWYQTLHYLRPFTIRKTQSTNSNITTMFKHNLLLSFRNFKKYKSSFFINLVGLSTGLACALLIYLWVNDELHVDKFHKNDDRLYQVMMNHQMTNELTTGPSTPDFLAENMLKEFPEIEMATGVTPSEWFGNFSLVQGSNFFKATGQFAEKDYFKMFSFPLIEGNAEQALDGIGSIAISKDLAEKIFKTAENVVGKTMEVQIINFKYPVAVTAVFENLPTNSTEHFDMVLNWKMWQNMSDLAGRQVNWGNHGPNTYLVLKEGTNIDEFNKKIAGYIKSKRETSTVTLFAAKYSDRYLHGSYENGVQAGGRIEYVRLFSIIAIFILLIACINFMNLSTAKASRRVKEVGVKKAIGADRKSLIFQYLNESILLTLFSLVVALLLVLLVLPQFNDITGKQLSLNFDLSLVAMILVITFATGLLSGSYPALYLSKFNAAFVLKGGRISTSVGQLWARKGLVVFQFAMSVILIVSVVVVYQQVNYVQSKNLGYSKENVIHFDKEGKVVENQDVFLAEIRNIPGVVNASTIQSIVVGSQNSTQGVVWEGKNPEDNIRFEVVTVNYEEIETLGIQVLEGRSFSREFGADEEGVIFNESAIKVMGMEAPLGKTVNFWGGDKRIIGIVKDFHFESLHQKVNPLVIRLEPDKTLKVMVKLEAGKEKETLERLEAFYGEFNPGYSFEYSFLDQDYQAQYIAEQRVSSLSKYFAGFAILISCLGLFGLASFTAERRLKEIGIRKILGSSVWNIVFLLTSDFTKMVGAAILIALPISYYLTSNWLQDFAYSIDLTIWYFAGAGIAAMIIAWVTVGVQTLRAARVNPADCLRYE